MNRCVYNYKVHIDKIVDGHTVGGLIDVGFREFRYRHVQIAALDLPDPKRLGSYKTHTDKRGAVKKHPWDGMTKDQAKVYTDSCKEVLRKLLFYGSGDAPKHGRTIVMASESPNYYGRSLAHLYIVTAAGSFSEPQLVKTYNGMPFLSVSRFVHYAADHKFDPVVVDSAIDSLELQDFKL